MIFSFHEALIYALHQERGVVYSISPMQLVGALLMGVYPTADIWSSFYNLMFP